jgi:predicted metalloprotease with PDZ domain
MFADRTPYPSHAWRLVALACVPMFLAACAGTQTKPSAGAPQATPAPPRLELTLRPESRDGRVTHLDVQLRLERPAVAAGARLLRMGLVVVSIPTARYDGDAIQARDARGPLRLTAHDEPPTPTGTFRHWTVDRDTVGDVEVRYRAPPREVSRTTRNGPLFDLRTEQAGVLGAGVGFLALPDTTYPYRVRLRWDLAAMPAGSRGVWSLGEGEVETEANAETLAFSYYAAGPMRRFPDGDAAVPFAVYWFTDPPFDLRAVATGIESWFAQAARFFRDEGGGYRVFIRSHPYPAGGGTALRRSFMFGWSAERPGSAEDLQGLLAHEITHNWPRLDGGEHADTAWYSEGTAEYYSILLSRRAGAIDDRQFLERINGRATGYYANPYRALSNAEAGKRFWSDARAQRVPYGRGFMYLAALDAHLRAASAGRRSVDDLVLEVLDRQRRGERVGLAEWTQMVERELGPTARAGFEAMAAGSTIVPPPSSFGPCLRPEPVREARFELGFDEFAAGVVRGLVAGSAAARAGLREGDEILDRGDVEAARRDPARELQVKVRRGDATLELRYRPRGEAYDGWRWVETGTPLAQCRY